MDAIEISNMYNLKAMIPSLRWEIRMSERFLLHYYIDHHDEDDVLFSSLLEKFEQIRDQVERFLKIEPRSKQEKLLMQSTFILFVVKTCSSRTFGWVHGSHTLFYLLDPKQDPDYMMRFRHEITHLVWGHFYGDAPPLFNEGIAVYAELMSEPGADMSELLSRCRVDVEQVPPLCEIALTEDFWARNTELAQKTSGLPLYVVSSLWIHFLVEKWGWDKLKTLFLMTDYEDGNIVDKFSKVYGQTLEDVDAEWRRNMFTSFTDDFVLRFASLTDAFGLRSRVMRQF